MENCKYWEKEEVIMGYYHDYPVKKVKQICIGTKECEECTCNGNPAKCNFYPEKRKENKSMNTAEMWIKAQEDGMCYEATNEDGYDGSIIYQKDKGFFDEEGYQVVIGTWNYPEDFMNEQWRLRTMTKSEAEARFNIKIVGD